MTNFRTYNDSRLEQNLHKDNYSLWTSDSTLCRAKSWRRSYEKTHIIFLAETEEAADLRCHAWDRGAWGGRGR